MTRARPNGVPEAAEWSEKDNEWILGPRDPSGAFHGEVSYWRPDGTLCCKCEHVDGKPHGRSRRFHEGGEISQTAFFERGALHGVRTWYAQSDPQTPTTERMHGPGMSLEITRVEVEYKNDRAVSFCYYLASGEEVERSGKPMRPRPAGVPSGAQYNEKSSCWIQASFGKDGEPDGLARSWTEQGALYAEENWRAGKREGASIMFRRDGSRRSQFHYRAGQLDGVGELYRQDGSVCRRAQYHENTCAGVIEDLDASGTVVRSESVSAPPASSPPAPPAPDELKRLDQLDDDESRSEAAAALADRGLSPAGMAVAVARGWGGSADRDVAQARACRRLVRAIAAPSFAERLKALELWNAPRLITEQRVTRVLDALADEPALDAALLGHELAGSGGPGLSIPLRAGGARARDALARRVAGNRLELARFGLAELPPEVRLFPWLEALILEHNQLRTLPREVGDLLKLSRLELGDNQLTALPTSLCDLTELRTLDIASNELAELLPEVCQLGDLATLNLSYNEFTTVPDAFAQLRSLKTLWLNDNPLTDLPQSFGTLPSLQFLHLGDVPWEEPPACLFELPALEELWLASPSLRRLPDAVGKLKRLRRLHVWYSSLESIPDVLYEMRGLEELRISNNPLPDGTVERLKAALPSCTIY